MSGFESGFMWGYAACALMTLGAIGVFAWRRYRR